jgi:hypothetical protein
MSDGRVRAAIEQMEAWLAEPSWDPAPEQLAMWQAEFETAMAGAEKAQGWPELIARAHAAGKLLEARSDAVAAERDRIQKQLASQDLGDRALKRYGAGLR